MFALLVFLAPICAACVTWSSAEGATTADSPYGWPVKPFHQPHPVRGYFGDPRTKFHGPPTMHGLHSQKGQFSFHQGVDISAPNGTAVYPVLSGTVSSVNDEWVRVTSDAERAFEYWHIRPQVRLGQRVEAYRTVLGRIMRPAAHVHLTAIEHGRVVNPLVRGRLTPYSDHTRPQVNTISLRRSDAARDLFPNYVRGRVHIVVNAHDEPSMKVPGIWANLPVTPALVTWRIQRPTGKVVLRQRTARDVRETVPHNNAFWNTYARGTFQNMCVFGKHYSYLQRGTYLFRLTSRPLDTRRLRDGVYEIVVTVVDARGNRASRSERFTVHNRPGWA